MREPISEKRAKTVLLTDCWRFEIIYVLLQVGLIRNSSKFDIVLTIFDRNSNFGQILSSRFLLIIGCNELSGNPPKLYCVCNENEKTKPSEVIPPMAAPMSGT